MTFEQIYRDMTARLGDEAAAFCWYFFDRSPVCVRRDGGEAPPDTVKKYGECMERVLSGEPMQYIFGYAPFYDLKILCEPGVLIPRYDTEVLVEEAIKTLPPGSVFADICCGTGCIAAAVLKHRPDTTAVCADISGAALRLTRQNLQNNFLDGRASVIAFDVFGDWNVLPKVDAILCNPPYINEADMKKLPENVRREPAEALYGGVDGLDFYRRIISASAGIFKGAPHIIFEIGYDQGKALPLLSPYPCKIKKDLSGNDRVCIIRG